MILESVLEQSCYLVPLNYIVTRVLLKRISSYVLNYKQYHPSAATGEGILDIPTSTPVCTYLIFAEKVLQQDSDYHCSVDGYRHLQLSQKAVCMPQALLAN